MELRQLEYFTAVAENNSFTAAARQLYVSQSTLSKSVKKLEEELDTPLFYQVGQRSLLTEAGTVLYEKARMLLQEAARTRDLVTSDLKKRQGQVKVATSCKLSLLPRACDLVANFARQHSHIFIDLNEASPEYIKDNLLRRNYDVGIIGEPAVLDQPAFDSHILFEGEYRLVVPVDHPLAGRKSVSYADLAGEKWIMYRTTFNQSHMIRAGCEAAGYTPKIIFTASQPELMLSLVSMGMGVTVQAWPKGAPETVGLSWNNLIGIPIENIQSSFAVKLITPRDSYRAPAVQAFLDYAASYTF